MTVPRSRRAIFSVALALLSAGLFADSQLESLAKPKDGTSQRATSTFRAGKDGRYDPKAPPLGNNEEKSNFDNFCVRAGQTHLIMDVKGPGVITHMWFTFLGPEAQSWAKEGSANCQEMLIRIYWDGQKKPAVEAPLGDFFANCFGIRSSVTSVPVIVEDADSYNCYWYMPFRKSARVEIVNQSTKNINLLYYNVDWIKKDKLPKDTPYFHAQYRQEYPLVVGRDYTILETKGKGHYVGTVLACRSRSPMWFGEGDEKIYIDGEKTASIWGTGTEDYFLSAWGLKTTSTPYFGVPYFDQWGIVGGKTSAYRWHIEDPIVFQKGIKVTMEHRGWISADENEKGVVNSWNEREDDFASVAFWYQTGESTFEARAPEGKDRKLSNLDHVISFAREKGRHGEGETAEQDLGFTDGAQVLYMPKSEKGAWFEVDFEVLKKEPVRLILSMVKAPDYGQYQAYLNGVKIGGAIDLYDKDVKPWEEHLLDFWPEQGKYTLRLECIGRNPASQGYFLGFESARLRERRPRVAQFARDKDKDWRKDPVLYR